MEKEKKIELLSNFLKKGLDFKLSFLISITVTDPI